MQCTIRKTFVSPIMGCWRFSDPRILGAVAASQQTFLLSPAPIQANTRGGDQKCRGLDLGPLEISSRGPLKGVVSAQKALQKSEKQTRELLGGTEEKSVSLIPRQINDFLQEGNRKNRVSGQTWFR